mgnify:CR=1 FL=1
MGHSDLVGVLDRRVFHTVESDFGGPEIAQEAVFTRELDDYVLACGGFTHSVSAVSTGEGSFVAT